MDKKEQLYEVRVLLNRVSVKENLSEYLSLGAITHQINTSNVGALRNSMMRNIHILGASKTTLAVTIGNEWALLSLAKMREFIIRNSKN